MANKRIGDVIYDNFDQYTGQPFNTKILTELPDGTVITDALVNNAVIFKNKPEHGGGYSVRSEFLEDNIIKPEWFGAKGDGITDDTVALKRAIEACKSNVIALSKAYVFTETLEIPAYNSEFSQQVIFRGVGRKSGLGLFGAPNSGISQLLWKGESLDYTVAITASHTNINVNFENVAIYNRTERTDVDGIVMNGNFTNCSVQEVTMSRFKRNFVINGWYYYTVFNSCRFAYAHEINFETTDLCNLATFYKCTFSNGQIGFKGTGVGDGINFIDCQLERNTQNALFLTEARVANIQGCYFEHNGSEEGIVTGQKSQIYFGAYGNSNNTPTILNMSGNYIMSNDGIHAIIVNQGGNSNIGTVSVNLENNTIPASLLTHGINDPDADRTYVVWTYLGFNKISVNLINNKYSFSDINNMYMPINRRPQDLLGFYAEGDEAINYIKPSWNRSFLDGEGLSTDKINFRNTSSNLEGSNSDALTLAYLDFPEIETQNGRILIGRQTNTSGNLTVEFYPADGTGAMTGMIDIKNGRFLGDSFEFQGTNRPVIKSGTTSPEGSVSAVTGSLYLQTATSTFNIWHKASGTGSTGWAMLAKVAATQNEVNTGTNNEKFVTPSTLSGRTATTSRTGLVSQSIATADISTADAIDEATAISLVNELKAKINSMLQSERDAGQRDS